jgi:hypothetical protein
MQWTSFSSLVPSVLQGLGLSLKLHAAESMANVAPAMSPEKCSLSSTDRISVYLDSRAPTVLSPGAQSVFPL